MKGVTDMLPSSAGQKLSKNAPTAEEIRKRAFEIHIERGGIYGFDLDDWLQAERELQQEPKNNKKGSTKTKFLGVAGL